MSNNITKVTKNRLCLQCGACYSVCPENAIEIPGEIDCTPFVKYECTNCGKCLRVCPGINPLNAEEGETLIGQSRECYIGYSSDPEIRFKASSGGIITSFNIHLLQSRSVDGVICIRQSQDSPYKNEVILATDVNDLLAASGSRYAPAFTCSGLKDLPLKEGGRYAIVGKPCDIQAVIKYSAVTKKNGFFKIAIFCAHTPAMAGTKEIFTSSGLGDNEIGNFSYRGNGWPGYFTAYSKSGDILLKRKYPEIWSSILCKRKYYSKRCFLCHDCTGEFADISVGDAWLKEYIGKSEGHSVIITRTETGTMHILDCIENNILTLEPSTPERIIESQKGLLHKKKNIFFKRAVARLTGEKIPNEKINYNSESNSLKNIPGLAKFFVLKKLK